MRSLQCAALAAFLAMSCVLKCHGEGSVTNATPFDSTFKLNCNSAAGSVGSYKPTATNSSDVQQIGQLVYQAWQKGGTNETCTAEDASSVQVNVTSACAQVVAGTNYAVLVSSSSTCQMNETDGYSVQSNSSIAAKVYMPLGSAPSQITLLKLVSLVEEEIS